MTIKEFAEKVHKSEKTVREWIEKSYVPGASIENDHVPDSAREPYTKARAKKGPALMKSMLKACANRKQILPAVYHISEAEFQALVDSLIRQDLLISFLDEGVTYYDTTLKGAEQLKVMRSPDWTALASLIVTAAPQLQQLLAAMV